MRRHCNEHYDMETNRSICADWFHAGCQRISGGTAEAADPDHPYAGSVTGMFHDQTAGENLGEYSVYLPSTIEQCVTGVMIAVPEDMTAKAFTQSLLGQAWQAVSEKYGIALAFAEAEDGQDWNLDGKDGRDEAAYLKAVSDNFHSKNKQKDAAFNLNERAFYVVGYDEGGAAAQEFAMTWPGTGLRCSIGGRICCAGCDG